MYVTWLFQSQKKLEPSLGRKAAAISALIGAGVGGGIAGGAAGLIATGIGCVMFTPAAPLALMGIFTVGILGGGAAAGTASALSAGEAVEKGFEKKDNDAATERVRKINATATS
jgi:hypothetical protein